MHKLSRLKCKFVVKKVGNMKRIHIKLMTKKKKL